MMHYSAENVWNDFSQSLERFIRKRVTDEQAAADLLQDVYVKIHTHIDDLHDYERLQGWVYQIARNTVYDYYRTRRIPMQLDETLAEPDDHEDSDDVNLRLAQSLHSMIDCLPEEYQEALRLADFEGITQQELAVRMGLSLSGAKSRVQRARKLLREALLACCHFEFDRLGKVIDYNPHCQCCTDNTCAR